MDKRAYSSNCKIVSAELLLLIARYTLPFSKSLKSNNNWNFWYVQNNHIKIRKNLSVRSSPVRQISKNCSPIQSCPAKIGFSPDPVPSSPDPCSSLAHTQSSEWFSIISVSSEVNIVAEHAKAKRMTIMGALLHWTQANSFELVVCQNHGHLTLPGNCD